MTRINCLPVETLSNKHLMAEYKEITRPFTKMRKRINENNPPIVPPSYVMGAGHESFFFNKLFYLFKRRQKLINELVNRGFNIDVDAAQDVQQDLEAFFQSTKYWRDWTPEPKDLYLNMARLVKRCEFIPAKEEMYSVH